MRISTVLACNFWSFFVKVGSFQKMMAKFSTLSDRHACEPKIVPELLFPVNVIDAIQVIFLINLAKKNLLMIHYNQKFKK